MTDDGDFRCGFIAVVGRPNVGKSTLVNTILGRKISIVTPKPQTTRHRIVGVHTLSHAQLLFVDTPGLHDGTGRALNRMMNRAASDAVTDADVNLFVCEAERFTDADAAVVERLGEARGAVIAVLNKVDRVTPKEALLERIAAVVAHHDFAEILPLSARRRDDVDRLVALLPGYLPRSPALFPESTVSDRGDAFRAAELVREKLTLLTHQELPYGLTVQTERYEREAGGLSFSAVIWVERESQKGMVVGRGGGLLKKAGRQVRLELKADLGMPVHVDLWVKVRDNWADSDRDLEQLGYDV